MDIAEIIKNSIENNMINFGHDTPISCRVEAVDKNNYEVIFACSGVMLIYDVFDVKDASGEFEPDDYDSEIYSGILKLHSCEVEGFSVEGNVDYYLDVFNRYQNLCSDVAEIMGSIDTYFDDRRTYFSY